MDNTAFQNLWESLKSAGEALLPAMKYILDIIAQGLQILVNLIREGIGNL
jgi:hypothetical protein